MQRSPRIHPIIGARRLDQLVDNVGAAEVELPPEVLGRLEEAAPLDPGFPTTFIQSTSPWVFGAAAQVEVR
jgi:aryl-alcohol dehydrogenase-like predicted oxidoreductase